MELLLKRPDGAPSMRIGPLFCVLFLAIAVSRDAPCQQPQSAAPPAGQAIYLQRCSRCHGAKGQGISAVATIAGPNLQAEHDRGDVIRAMETGPSHMPVFTYMLSVPEMRTVAEYVTQKIAVIPLGQGNLAEGGELYRADCATCHRTMVRGGALAFTDVNAPALTDKSAALIAGAIRWGPGPMPPFPASILSDRQLDSIVQYVKYVQHPPSPGGRPISFAGPVAEGFVGLGAILVLIACSMWIERGGKG